MIEVFERHPDDVATCSEATQHSRIFWVSFTNAKRSDNEVCPDARPNRLDVVLFWEESRYSGKAVAEDCLDKAIFRSDAPQPESEFV
jgi:hypothetical protein